MERENPESKSQTIYDHSRTFYTREMKEAVSKYNNPESSNYDRLQALEHYEMSIVRLHQQERREAIESGGDTLPDSLPEIEDNVR